MGQKKLNKSDSNEEKDKEKINFIIETIDKKIEGCKKNIEKISNAIQVGTSAYMTSLSATSSKNDKDQLFDSYTKKNKDLRLKSNYYESKIKRFEREKEHILSTGKVNKMTYWLEKSSQKISRLVDLKKDDSQQYSIDEGSQLPNIPLIADKDATLISVGDLRNHISNTYKCSSIQSNDSDSVNRGNSDGNYDAHHKAGNHLENEIGNTLMLICNYVESFNDKIDFLQREFERQDEMVNEKLVSMKVELKEFVKEEIFKSEQEIYINSEQALSKFSDNFCMRLDKVEHALNTLIEREKRPETSSGQQLLVKLANVFVQILTTIVMTFSSFADTISKLDSRIQMFLLIFLMSYVFIQTIRPIFEVLFINSK